MSNIQIATNGLRFFEKKGLEKVETCPGVIKQGHGGYAAIDFLRELGVITLAPESWFRRRLMEGTFWLVPNEVWDVF